MQDVFSEFFSLKGKTAVVTGSGRGIGKAIATMLARAGADVVIWDIIKENAEATAKEIAETTGRKTWVYLGDLLQQEKIKEYVQDILSLCGEVDILVNNAGVQVRKPALEITIEEWYRVLNTHLTATFLVTQAFVPHFIQRGGGKVINLGSLNCFMAVPDIMPYVASKMGILGLTRSMCVEWSKYNINVNALAPGFVATELTRKLFENPEKKEWVMKRIPMGRLADPEKDLGCLAIFLASKASDYINGQIIYSDGGWTAA